jgi:hypothetical protein
MYSFPSLHSKIKNPKKSAKAARHKKPKKKNQQKSKDAKAKKKICKTPKVQKKIEKKPKYQKKWYWGKTKKKKPNAWGQTPLLSTFEPFSFLCSPA